MYYYILEQPKNSSVRRQQDMVKNLVNSLGIAGETVCASPARTVEELTNMGKSKGYSTIVAVGGDKLVNKIISLIQGTELVLGVIPIEASMFVQDIIEAHDVKTACENLRFRRLDIKDLAVIEPNKYFLTEANIMSPKPILGKFDLDTVNFQTTFTNISIDHKMHLYVEDTSKTSVSLFKSLLNFLGTKALKSEPSKFTSRRIKIETAEPVAVTIDGEIVAKTPILVKSKPKALKIVVGRGKIKTN